MQVTQRIHPWLVGVALPALLAFGVASTAYAMGAAEAVPHAAPTINLWTWDAHAPPVGWFIVDFILFVGLLVYFTRKPVRAAFLARHERIKKALNDAEGTLKVATERYEEYRGKLADVDEESAQHVERGRVDGKAEQDEIVRAARAYAERLKADATAVAASEGQKARERLQRQVVTELLKRTEALLIAETNAQDRERLLEESLVALEQAPHDALGRAKGGAVFKPGGAA